MFYIHTPKMAGRMGHQLSIWCTSFMLSELFDLKFIHSPLTDADWESQLNFGHNELSYDDIKDLNLKVVDVPHINPSRIKDLINKDYDVIDKITDSKVFTTNYSETIHNPYDFEKFINQFDRDEDILFRLWDTQTMEIKWPVEDQLREKYKHSLINKNCPLHFDKDKISITVHIRRGDVNERDYPTRWVSNDYYVDILNKIVNHFGDRLDIHIYSEGDINNFQEFNKFNNIYFHLNENVYSTFHHMVHSDILFTGRSGLSYFASIISENKIIASLWDINPKIDRLFELNETGDNFIIDKDFLNAPQLKK